MIKKSLIFILLVALSFTAAKASSLKDVRNVSLTEKESSKAYTKIAKEFHVTEKVTPFEGQFVLNLSDDIITLSYLNKALENVTFQIEDEFGSTLFSNKARKKALVHHRLSTLELPEGVYTAYVRVGHDFYEQTFKVEK